MGMRLGLSAGLDFLNEVPAKRRKQPGFDSKNRCASTISSNLNVLAITGRSEPEIRPSTTKALALTSLAGCSGRGYLRVTRVTPPTFYRKWMVQVAHQGAGAPQVHGALGRAFARN
jgi:hypothetical protein